MPLPYGTTVESFTGRYRFLSNFFMAAIPFDGQQWASVEHLYQALKTHDSVKREEIRRANSSAQAKRLGKRVKNREDWEEVKVGMMSMCLTLKFSAFHPRLMKSLLDTGDAELVEGNTWGDTYWGVYNGVGENQLGKLLMRRRMECKVL